MAMQDHGAGLTANGFLSEVREFRAAIANPALTPEARKRAFGLIVSHAAGLKPSDAGYEAAGVALKEALCTWLDFEPTAGH